MRGFFGGLVFRFDSSGVTRVPIKNVEILAFGVAVLRILFVFAVSIVSSLVGSNDVAFAATKDKSPAKSASASSFNFDPASERDFVNLLCNDGEYFRECFSSTKATCTSALRAEVKTCKQTVAKNKIKITNEVQLFAEIGVCVGDGIEKKWRNQKTNNPKCDKKESWR